MKKQALLERIAGIQNLTASERKLARYFEQEFAALPFEIIESLSKKSGVSKSSISRFATRLGYANFRAFLQELRQDAANGLDSPLKRHAFRVKKSDPAEVLLHKHLQGVCTNLRQTLEQIKPGNFTRALELLCDENRRLFLLGCGGSGFLMGYCGMFMSYIRNNITPLDGDAPGIAFRMAKMEGDAVFLVMATRRYASLSGTVLRYAFERGHETILLTDSYSAPCLQYATVPLVVHLEGESMLRTRGPALAVLEALISGMSAHFGGEVPERLAAIDELNRLLGSYQIR